MKIRDRWGWFAGCVWLVGGTFGSRALIIHAQEKGAERPRSATAKPPDIPEALQIEYLLRHSEAWEASGALKAASERESEALKRIQEACGKDFVPGKSPDGNRLACVPKPTPATVIP